MGPGGFGGGMRGGPFKSLLKDGNINQSKVKKGTFKRLLKFAKKYRILLLIFLIIIIIDSAIGVANPLILREIINNGILGHNKHIIYVFAVVVAILAVINAFLSFLQRYISAKVGEGLIFDMRTKIFEHIQTMSLAFFARTQTGALVSRLNNDVLGAQEAFTDVLSNVVGNLISVVLTLAVMFYLSWELTILSIIMLPIFLFPARWLGRKLYAITTESYNLNAAMNNTMIERFNVSGALLSKTFGDSRLENKLFRNRSGRVRDIGVTQAVYARFLFIALFLTASLATALIYGLGGALAVDKILNVGTLVALTSYLNRLYAPLTQLSNLNVDVMTALVSFDRVFEILDLQPLIKNSSRPVLLSDGKKSIEFKNVTFSYPNANEVSLASLESVANLSRVQSGTVLKDISFKIKPGEIVALVGPSGAGKTTISQLIARLYDARTGQILIDNIDIKDIDLQSLKAHIGMVAQDTHLFHESIKDNLLFANPSATEADMQQALRDAQLEELINSLPEGLETVVGDRGYRLSGGEKQRLAIARVLLKKPDILILDEATSNLDSTNEQLIQTALNNVFKDRTSVVIAHRLSTIKIADQILVVNKGKIVESGSHQELLDKGQVYYKLYKNQFDES